MNHDPQHQTATILIHPSEAERLFIWGFRAIAQRQRLGWPTFNEIRQVYEHFGVEDAVSSVDALLETFACTAHTAIELHCPACRHVSSGELVLLEAMWAAQHELPARMRQRFECWLPPIAADWITEPACGLGKIFRSAGLLFPDRVVQTSMVDETMKVQSWPVGSPTLH